MFLVKNILGARPEDKVNLSFDGYQAIILLTEQDAISDLVTPWIIFYAIACVVSLIAVFMKLKVFYRQLRWACLHMCGGVT